MSEELERMGNKLNAMALEVVTLEEGDIPAMGRLLNALGELEEAACSVQDPSLGRLIQALNGYLEKLILGEKADTRVLGEAVTEMQAIHRALSSGVRYKQDVTSILKAMGDDTPASVEQEAGERYAVFSDEKAQPGGPIPHSGDEMGEEERQILGDFIVESLENLASIEMSLMDLEQDPENKETINAIFRPFHTIKGVSGFLNLQEINRLSHGAENLLDKARNGEMSIDERVVDIILESIDALKGMIQGVQQGLETGRPLDDGTEIEPLLRRIEALSSGSEKMANQPLGEILLDRGIVDREKIDRGLQRQRREPERKLGEILVAEGDVPPKEVISALRDQKRFGKKGIDLQVKVDTRKLDNLVDMTGELVIAQSMLRQNEKIVGISDQKLYHALNQLNQITSTLQKTAMSMRMVPIRNTFHKMVRLVRDLAKNSGKEVELRMHGEETEIDRSMVDDLYEPMVHMIRNAVDHGLEPPEDRERLGKNRTGTIALRAFYRGGNIVIEISDDGRGLDREKIIQKAKAKGLVSDETALSEAETYHLIFTAGFSTAAVVTDISGRGVGMDVVKRAIEKLRGRVEITSRPDQGTRFTISLPLTLAIIEGMVVRVATERYIIPALAILESFRPTKEQCATVKRRAEVIKVRGKLVPLVRLDRLFGIQGDPAPPWERLVVAVEHEGRQLCLLLDELMSKEEVVIKSLGEALKHLKGLAGGAIMGDGRVGLILDMAGIFDLARAA